MAFGLLVNMFHLLSGKVEGRLDRMSAYLIACARLHNFIIREDKSFGMPYTSLEDEMEQLDITPHQNAPFGMDYLPVVPNEEFDIFGGISYTQEGIIQALQELEIYRPSHNIEQRQRELQHQTWQLTMGEYCDREFISPL
jgi:hypothetical protein